MPNDFWKMRDHIIEMQRVAASIEPQDDMDVEDLRTYLYQTRMQLERLAVRKDKNA